MMILQSFAVLLCGFYTGAWAAGLKSFEPIRAHYPIISVEKDVNPQNVMIVYTKLDEKCRLVADPDHIDSPTIDFYWLMNRKSYKPVHSMIKSGIADRIKLDAVKDTKQFTIKLDDLSEIKTDIPVPAISVVAKKAENKRCVVESYMQLGPSDQNQQIRLDSIYSESEKTLAPPFRKVTHITLNGVDRKSGKKISRRYWAVPPKYQAKQRNKSIFILPNESAYHDEILKYVLDVTMKVEKLDPASGTWIDNSLKDLH